jgi:hypothetical protein
MNDRCRFGAAACRQSHGWTVSVDQLEPCPLSPSAEPGAPCLVKMDTGLWSQAMVLRVTEFGCVIELAESGKPVWNASSPFFLFFFFFFFFL